MKTYSTLFPAEVGHRIRDIRIRHNMTQREFAGLIGISSSYLGAIERGTRPVSRNVMQRLHDCFALSCDYLLHGSAGITPVATINRVAEGSSYRTRRNFFFLLSSCEPKEADECCRLLAAYLNRRRDDEIRLPDISE